MADYQFNNDKVVNEMGRDGLTEHNLNTGETTRVSNRFQDFSYSDKGTRQEEFRQKRRSESGGSARENGTKNVRMKYYERQIQKNEGKQERHSGKQQKYAQKLQKKESHMHKKWQINVHKETVYDYEAYGKLGRPRDYVGEEHYKNATRFTQKVVKPYRTRDLAVTRTVKQGQRLLFRQAAREYFEGEENNNSLSVLHEGYSGGKPVYRSVRRKISHPIAKGRNHSYTKTRKNALKFDKKTNKDEKQVDKYRFKLDMEKAWQKEMQKDENKNLSAKAKIKKKMQYKHSYKKKYEQTFVQKSKKQIVKVAKKAKEIILTKIKLILAASGVIIAVLLLFSMFSSCAALISSYGAEGTAGFIAGLFMTGFDQITLCDEYFSSMLCQIQNLIEKIEENHPDYDEYQYWVNGEQVADAEAMMEFVVYNQMHLASYLSTVKVEYTLESATGLMDALFEQMFILEQKEIIEQRERIKKDEEGNDVLDEDGNPVMEIYDFYIWKTELTVKAIDEIMPEILNEDELSQYETFCYSEGALQIFGSPFAFDWTNKVSSPYGYRNHPIYGKYKLHEGIDIAVPEGTKIYSVMDGTVTISKYSDSAGNYIAIIDQDGYVSKYMHCSSLLAGVGKKVKKGELIALAGNTGNSTGSHLHLQIEDEKGKPINPVYVVAQYGEETVNE